MTGWTAVQPGADINIDLENSPFQIRTDSVHGSNEKVDIILLTAGGQYAGGVYLFFSSPPQYQLNRCTSKTNFPTALPTETDLIWTLTLTRTSGTVRIIIHCNNKEVLNFVLSDATCSGDWSATWSEDVGKIRFSSCCDKASDFYRPGIYNLSSNKFHFDSYVQCQLL